MRVYVGGPITYDSNEGNDLVELANFLRSKGFSVDLPHDKPINKDDSIDFRDKVDEANGHYRDLERYVSKEMDIMVAKLNGASSGRTLEQMLAKKYGKHVIGYAPEPLRGPWAVINTDLVVRTKEEIVAVLRGYEIDISVWRDLPRP